jgi:DNA helicase IV
VPAIETHPDLEAEQAYVLNAYECMAAMLDTVERFGGHGRNDFEREAFERWREARISSLSDTTSALVFGRLDEAAGERYYIGRRHVKDAENETIVVDWRAPVARGFYRASAADPMGLARRRQFLIEAREILGISDDEFDEAHARDAVPLTRGAEVLNAELRRRRTGEMRDIVATIQAEQDVVIRAPLDGVLVVQGGPGTGKTAIGLHRASFLLYEHRAHLTRTGVLVVGPNPTFMRYISQVLPSLGEFAVTQRTVADLSLVVRVTARDEARAEKLKGDARMAAVLTRALDLRARGLDGDVVVTANAKRFVFEAARVSETVEALRARGVPYKTGREMLRNELLRLVYANYQAGLRPGSTMLGFDDAVRAVRASAEFKAVLDAVWPATSPETLVGELLASRARLADAARGILSDEEQASIARRARAAFTPADRPLLDEALALIEGAPDTYGHLVVDEAQDLSPMQLRMLGRRCPSGSMTVLGDLGQATGVWGHLRWDEVLEHLPQPHGAHVEELRLGYRVSARIMAIAAEVLRDAAPDLTAPLAVRADEGVVSFAATAKETLGAQAAEVARAMSERGGATAIIVPGSLADGVRAALSSAGVAFAEATRDGLGADVTLVAAADAKGLEFDGVVLVEPALVVEEGGLRMLYVALTRAMRDLVVVHSAPLPPSMERARTHLSAA